MAATNSKVVQIHNADGEVSQYTKVSARVPEFLKEYGPQQGYRVTSESTDYLDMTQGRKALFVTLAEQGNLSDKFIQELANDRKVVFKSRLLDNEGNVVAEASAIKPVWSLKDYESGETAAFQRLLARLGFGGDVFDEDEQNDMLSQDLDFQTSPQPSPTQTVTAEPEPVEQPREEIAEGPPAETQPTESKETVKSTQQPAAKSSGGDGRQQQRGVKADATKVQPAQLRQLESMARVKQVECPVVNTPEEFREAMMQIRALPLPE